MRPFIDRMIAACAKQGVAADRLLMFNRAPDRAQVLQRLRLADIYLDSYPFAGATSLLDPLAVGLPSIVMEGATFRSLVGAALLRELKLDDFVVKDDRAYIDLAVKLALDRTFRDAAAERFVRAMAGKPRFLDPKWYSSAAGDALISAWEAHRESDTPIDASTN
jgi:predicted O-linked N-acetylglucosamine transferase (SPINDLY family)